MPHIRFRALEETHVQALSDTLVGDLARALNTSEDNFTFELIGSRFFYRNKEVPAYPYVEVLWFARSPEVMQRMATIITDQVKAVSGAADVAVVFQVLPEADYFENGSHF